MTRRRAWRTLPFAPSDTPRLAIVIRCSTNGRSSFAFATVVVRCSWRSSAVAWFRSIAIRCSVTRPSLRCETRCLIADSVLSSAVDPHAEAEAHGVQDFLDLVQALATEVLGLEHFRFGLLYELA